MNPRHLTISLLALTLVLPVGLGQTLRGDAPQHPLGENDTSLPQTEANATPIELDGAITLQRNGSVIELVETNEPVAPNMAPVGLGSEDAWIDANGDTMFGNLVLDGADIVVEDNRLWFTNGVLSARTGQDGLHFAGQRVCTESLDRPGCGDLRGVTAGQGLVGGGTTGEVTLAADMGVLQARVAGACDEGSSIRLIREDGTVECQVDQASLGWALGGNAGTSAGEHFLGTTDAEPLIVKVADRRALLIEPGITPSIVAGSHANAVGSGVQAAAIGGGGSISNPNVVHDLFGTIAGGSGNIAGADDGSVTGQAAATVGGGQLNRAKGLRSMIGGGSSNTASGTWSTVSGGSTNTASGAASMVGGGVENNASASFASVAGGIANDAFGVASMAAGHRARAIHDGAFVWSGITGTSASDDFQSTGTDQFLIDAMGGVGIGTNDPDGALHVQAPAGESTGTITVSPGVGTNGNAEVYLAEPDKATGGIRLQYNGSANQLEIIGWKQGASQGKHLVLERDSGELRYGEPREQTLDLAASAFRDKGASVTAAWVFRDGYIAAFPQASVMVDLDLPDGAILGGLDCLIYDDDPDADGDFLFRLDTVDLSGSSPTSTRLGELAATTSGTSTQLKEVSMGGIAGTVIDAEASSYWLHLIMSQSPNTAAEQVRFYGCSLDYQSDQLVP